MSTSASDFPDAAVAGTPAAGAPPLLTGGVPPIVPPAAGPAAWRRWLSVLLSVCLGLFLLDGIMGVADDSLALLVGAHPLAWARFGVGLLALLLAGLVYGLMLVTPAIPKGVFVPLALFYLALQLAGIPLTLLYSAHLVWMTWGLALLQVGLGLGLLAWAQRGEKVGWRLVPVARVGGRGFSGWNVLGFALANLLGLVPLVAVYLWLCLAGLVNHFTDGFMTLQREGFQVQARKYVRADGKTIQLFPMAHVGEADFYRDIAKTFPTNSLILMEGVSDEKHLLQHKISYQRMAKSLGLTEQHEQFEPTRGVMVAADVDVSAFSTNTLGLLNVIIRLHSGGLEVGTIQELLNYSAVPGMQEELLADILYKRNEHLLGEIRRHLPESEHLVVPWGVAHMPGIAREIQRAGFRLEGTEEYMVIRFQGAGPGKH